MQFHLTVSDNTAEEVIVLSWKGKILSWKAKNEKKGGNVAEAFRKYYVLLYVITQKLQNSYVAHAENCAREAVK